LVKKQDWEVIHSVWVNLSGNNCLGRWINGDRTMTMDLARRLSLGFKYL